MDNLNSNSLDDLLERALQEHVIDHYDSRGLCVVIRCGERTYTSARPYARDLLNDLLQHTRSTSPNAS